MAYRSLEKLYYMDSSAGRDRRANEEAELRLNADSTFRTGIVVREGELFVACPRELVLLQEQVLRAEVDISGRVRALEPLALAALIRSLVFDEVVQTNELEGVRSSRQEVAEAFEHRSEGSLKGRRLRETVRIYTELTEGRSSFPSSLEEIRSVYDRIMDAEPTADSPDGRLFRAGGVDIIGSSGKAVHSGVASEPDIEAYLRQMIGLVANREVPALLSATAAHYIFEYVHPFYDGNGRTGRYLLSLALSASLSSLTVLTLSRTIVERKAEYYRSFTEAEKRLNHGELTFFVMNMLRTVRAAQERLLDELGEYSHKVSAIRARIDPCLEEYGLVSDSGRDADKRRWRLGTAVYGLMLYEVLDLPGGITQPELCVNLGVSSPVARRVMAQLEAAGLVDAVKKKPLVYRASGRLVGFFDAGADAIAP